MAPEVRLNGPENEPLGIVPLQEALRMAGDLDVDLVEIAANSETPVCKILDYGKFKYLLKKKEHQARRKQHQVVIKELRVRPKIDVHDLETKLKQARGFLQDGDKLQVTMPFRGREIGFREHGLAIMHRIRDALADVGKVERMPLLEGNRLIMMIQPSGNHQPTAPAKPKAT